MSFELRLSFSGLTALVPRKEATEQGTASEWLVVMPALEGGETVEKGDRKFSLAPHQPVLVANARAVRPTTTKEARLRLRNPKAKPGDEDSDLLFQLDREVLEIAAGTSGFGVRSNGVTGQVPNVFDPDELHDIRWVPPIDQCAQGPVPFDRNLLNLENLRPTNRLAGVVRLDRGTLETTNVHRGKQNQPVPYEFRRGTANGGEPHRQALATEFRLRVPVEQDEARLVLTDKNGNPRLLVVGKYDGCPVNEHGEQCVEVKVFNRELEKILGFEPPPDLAAEEEDRADTDFVIFYVLSPVWSAISADDVALPHRGGSGGGGSSRPCEPPQYTGFGD